MPAPRKTRTPEADMHAAMMAVTSALQSLALLCEQATRSLSLLNEQLESEMEER